MSVSGATRVERHVLRLLTVIRHLPGVAILAFDRRLRCFLAEGAALERLGWPAGDVLGRRLHELAPGAAGESVDRARRALAGESSGFSARARDGDGWIAVEVVPLIDDGDVIGGMLVARDGGGHGAPPIDDGDHFRRAFDEAPIGMALVSLDGTFLRTNRRLSLMTGHSPGDLIGRRFDDLCADAVEVDPDAITALYRGGVDRYEVERRFVTASGPSLRALVSFALARDASGRPLLFIVDVVDRSARRRRRSERDAALLLARLPPLATGTTEPWQPPAWEEGAGALTQREVQILRLAAAGFSGPAIASHLIISLSTVKTHFEHIYEKLGVNHRSAAVAYAMRAGLIV